MTGLSLFSGIGGLDLAFEWAGGTVGAMVEKDPFCQRKLGQGSPTHSAGRPEQSGAAQGFG